MCKVTDEKGRKFTASIFFNKIGLLNVWTRTCVKYFPKNGRVGKKKWVRRVRPKDRGVWSFPMNSPRSEGHLSLSPRHLHVLRTHEAAFPSVTRCWRTSYLDQPLKTKRDTDWTFSSVPVLSQNLERERNPQQLDIMDSPSPSCPYHFTHSLIILLRLKSTFLSLNIPRCGLWRIFQSHKSFR